MKPEKVSAAPQERYIDFLCHPFEIWFCYGLVSIIMTSLRDLVGCGFCFLPPLCVSQDGGDVFWDVCGFFWGCGLIH